MKRFRKVKIEDEEHLKYAIAYVHTNAEKHGLLNNFRDWEHSSYKKIISVKPTYLLKEEVLKLYGGVEKFEMYHHEFLTNRASSFSWSYWIHGDIGYCWSGSLLLRTYHR